jgi:hypothetical protein
MLGGQVVKVDRLLLEVIKDVLVGRQLFDLGADFSKEGVGGENAFVGPYLLLDGVIFISGVLYLLVLLFFEFVESMLQEGVLLLVLLGLLSDLVKFGLLLLKQVLCPLLGDLYLF